MQIWIMESLTQKMRSQDSLQLFPTLLRLMQGNQIQQEEAIQQELLQMEGKILCNSILQEWQAVKLIL